MRKFLIIHPFHGSGLDFGANSSLCVHIPLVADDVLFVHLLAERVDGASSAHGLLDAWIELSHAMLVSSLRV